ncbi:hypothetical protein M9H77_31413 [Catharanthus roseus]|uniref:Uncharacterized protein n=1 Tax=Catharanthus roseus TaxID=4058 RepID=A0ACC0A3X6_CATRO|nr:hypothetical protein M9H77_31413 [Catharanthus roseus]
MGDTKSSFHLALAVSNIKTHIPITLVMENVQYANWAELFKIHCRSHSFLHHIILPTPKDGSVKEKPPLTNEEQELWDILDAVDNEHSRAISLEEEFTSTYLRNFSSVSAYCQHLKTLVEQFKNIGAPVSNHRLVLRMAQSVLALEEVDLKQVCCRW